MKLLLLLLASIAATLVAGDCAGSCLNGGVCQNSQCVCPVSFTGARCEVALVCLNTTGDYTFSGAAASVAQYTLPQPLNFSSLSVCAWESRTSVGGEDYIFGLGATSGNTTYLALQLGFPTSANLLRWSTGGDNVDAAVPNLYTRNVWHHICGTLQVDAGLTTAVMVLYVDGSAVGTANVVSFVSPLMTAYVGCSSRNTQANFDGHLRDVRLYARALSAGDVTALYTQGGLASDTGLLLYLPFLKQSLADASPALCPLLSSNSLPTTLYSANSFLSGVPTACSTAAVSGLTCKNSGRSYDGVHCVCAPGWTGSVCDVVADVCAAAGHPCNTGTCNQYTGVCACPPYKFGPTCEQNATMCNPNAGLGCLNGGSCTYSATQSLCSCPPDYSGSRCEVPVVCQSTTGDMTFILGNPYGIYRLPQPINGISFSVCARILRLQPGGDDYAIGLGTTGSANKALQWGFSGNSLAFNFYSQDNSATIPFTSVDGQFHFYCTVFSTAEKTYYYYADGNLFKTDTKSSYAPLAATDTDLYVGRRAWVPVNDAWNDGSMRGRMREVRVYARALSGADVASLNNGTLADESGLLLFLPFTQDAADYSPYHCAGVFTTTSLPFTLTGTNKRPAVCSQAALSGRTCMNGGTSFDGVTCVCPIPYDGPSCELFVDQCTKAGRPCNNSATCDQMTATCLCPGNFTGPTCSSYGCPVCNNGGECTSSLTCSCGPGPAGTYYGGPNCDTLWYRRNCQYGSPCYFAGDQYGECSCLPSYTGTVCEETVACFAPIPSVPSMTVTGDFTFSTENGTFLLYNLPQSINGISYSFCAWVKRASTSSNDFIFGLGGDRSTRNALHIGYQDSSTLRLGMFGADCDLTVPSAMWNTDWHHVCTVYDASAKTSTVYLDATTQNTCSNVQPLSTSSKLLAIGRHWFRFGDEFDGRIRDVRVFARALAAAEVVSIRTSGGLLGSADYQLLHLPMTRDFRDFSQYHMPMVAASGLTVFNSATVRPSDCAKCRMSTSVCQNGGVCVDAYACVCPPGFRGVQCETAIVDVCIENSRPCIQGVCDQQLGYCQCPEAYSGIQCELDAVCAPGGPQSCLNGGKCVSQGSAASVCQCPSSFTGDRCQVSRMCDLTGSGDFAFSSFSNLTYTLPTVLAGISFSTCAWAKRAGLNNGDYVLGVGAFATYNHLLHFGYDYSGGLSQFKLGTWVNDCTLTPIPAQYDDLNWHHLCASFSADTNTTLLYIDNTIVYSCPMQPFQGNETTLFIGRRGDNSGPFDGRIRDVRLYARALSTAEVGQIFTNGRLSADTDATGLLAYLPFTADKKDWSPNHLSPLTAVKVGTFTTGSATQHVSGCSGCGSITCLNGGVCSDGRTCTCPPNTFPPACTLIQPPAPSSTAPSSTAPPSSSAPRTSSSVSVSSSAPPTSSAPPSSTGTSSTARPPSTNPSASSGPRSTQSAPTQQPLSSSPNNQPGGGGGGNSNSVSDGAIVGIVIGSVAGVALIALALYCVGCCGGARPKGLRSSTAGAHDGHDTTGAGDTNFNAIELPAHPHVDGTSAPAVTDEKPPAAVEEKPVVAPAEAEAEKEPAAKKADEKVPAAAAAAAAGEAEHEAEGPAEATPKKSGAEGEEEKKKAAPPASDGIEAADGDDNHV